MQDYNSYDDSEYFPYSAVCAVQCTIWIYHDQNSFSTSSFLLFWLLGFYVKCATCYNLFISGNQEQQGFPGLQHGRDCPNCLLYDQPGFWWLYSIFKAEMWMSNVAQIFAVHFAICDVFWGQGQAWEKSPVFFDWLVQFPMFYPSRCCPLGDERRPPFLSEICWGTGLSLWPHKFQDVGTWGCAIPIFMCECWLPVPFSEVTKITPQLC